MSEPGGRDDKEIRPLAGTAGASLGLVELQKVFISLRKELVRYLTRRTGSSETAADISHDVFEKLYESTAVIPDRQRAKSYIYRVAGNLAIDQYRVESRRREILSGSQVLFEDVEAGPEQQVFSKDELGRIEAFLDELPPKCKAVLLLSRMHGYSHREIAEQLSISVSLVEKYQLRALRHCRAHMTPED